MVGTGSRHYRVIALCLAFASFIVFCNIYLFQPMLPHMAEHYQVSSTIVNWLFAAATLTLSIALLPWAIASETYGRRRIMLIGLMMLPFLEISMVFADSWWFLVFARGCIGIAAAAFNAVAVAYMVEELTPDAFVKAIGMYIAANSLGGISGRLLGGIMTSLLSWQMAVIVMAAVSVVGAIMVFWLLPEQRNFKPTKRKLSLHMQSILENYSNPILSLAMLIGAINFALFVNLYSVMGFRLAAEPYSLPVGLTSLIFICYLGGTVSSNMTGIWKKKYSSMTGMVLGALISMSGMIIATIESIPAMLAGLLLISFGAFFTHTLAYGWVGQHAIKAKATATAQYLVNYYIGGSAGGFYLLFCWQQGGWEVVALGGGVLYALLFIVVWLLWRIELKANRAQHIPVEII
ncbi:MFS transporter [Vibrio sp. HA2012]|uniref:MFS transporter n=1 Tax=Vibrio sp. HA2012 TaxID=1971595 RepID=UPI000C2C88AD|nr:MFS transporter [Vibrio sp. HA2012]PJC86840.1 MFS transporter [Vibrio sp. HA2012]